MGWLRWAILIVLVYCFYQLIKPKKPRRQVEGSDSGSGRKGIMVQDPWCKIYTPEEQSFKARVDGEVMHFCSADCRDRYVREKKSAQT